MGKKDDEVEMQQVGADGQPNGSTVLVRVMPMAHVHSMAREIGYQLDVFVDGECEAGTAGLRRAIDALIKASEWKEPT